MTRRRGYGQVCPVSKAVEILGERWTLVIVRELLYGSRHFNELRRGIPLISPGVLSQRLRELEQSGIVEREAGTGRSATAYRLLRAGRELAPLVEQLGIWGHRWAVRALRQEDLDASYLMWATYRCFQPQALGRQRGVIAYELFDAPANKRRWWIVVAKQEIELCVRNPGYAINLTISGKVKTFAELFLGHLDPRAAVRSGAIVLKGDAELARKFGDWCPRSSLSSIKPAPANAS